MDKFRKLLMAAITAVCFFMGYTVPGEEDVYAKTTLSAPEAVSFMYIPGSDDSYGYMTVTNVSDGAYVDASGIISSDPDTVVPEWVETTLSSTGGESCSNIYLRIKKSGSATISYMVGGTPYSTKVIVTSYKNPLSHISFSNINNGEDFSAMTEEAEDPAEEKILTLSGSVQSTELSVTTESEWVVSSVSLNCFSDNNTVRSDSYYETSEGSAAGTRVFRFSGIKKTGDGQSDSADLQISFRNVITGQVIRTGYSIR